MDYILHMHELLFSFRHLQQFLRGYMLNLKPARILLDPLSSGTYCLRMPSTPASIMIKAENMITVETTGLIPRRFLCMRIILTETNIFKPHLVKLTIWNNLMIIEGELVIWNDPMIIGAINSVRSAIAASTNE